MSFLFALSQADQVQKKAKRDALVAALQEQVLEKQAKKDAAIAQQKREEEEELRKLEAKGLDMWGRPIRVKEDEPAPGNRSQRGVGESSARHNRGARNSTTILSPTKHHNNHSTNVVGERASAPNMNEERGNSKQFMGALSQMFGPSEQERVEKERARDKLKRDLAEQVEIKRRKRQREIDEQKMREEQEMRENEAKGLDIWGRPLPPGRRIPKLNLKQRASDGQVKNSSYRSPRVRTSPRSSRSKQAVEATSSRPQTSPKTIVPKIDLSYNKESYNDGPEYDNEDISNFIQQNQGDHINGQSTDRMSTVPNNIDELTSLCQKLLREQKELRAIVEKRETILEQRRSPVKSPMRSKQYERRRRYPGHNQKNIKKNRKPRKPKTPPKSNMPPRRRTTQEINALNANLPFGRRLAARRARRSQASKMTNESENGVPRDYKLTKDEKEDAKRRRAAVRAEYANRSRKRNFSNPKGPTSDAVHDVSQLDRVNQLDGKSKFLYDFDKKGAAMMMDKIPDSLNQAVKHEILKYKHKQTKDTTTVSKAANKARKRRTRKRVSENNNNHNIPAPPSRSDRNAKPPLPKRAARRRQRKSKPMPKFVFVEPDNL